MSAVAYEGGLRPGRIEYIRESTVGVPPSNPTWVLFSDTPRSVEPGFAPGVEGQIGLGDPDFINHFAGTQSPTLAVAYDLQQKSGSGETFLASGSPNDAVTDAFQRDSDNRIQNTHTVVRRIEQSDIDAANTVNGSTSLDTRQYIVGVGGYPNATLTNDPESPQPVLATVEYEFEKLRMYQIDQPASGTTIDVISTDANDSGTVTVEDEGANTTEDISITANGTASGTESFSDIDAVYLDSEQAGDITISDGTNDLMVIRGQNSYDHGEGDLGVPALGTGSHASAIDQPDELTHDDAIERPSGTAIADVINTTEFSVDNAFDGIAQVGTPRRALSANGRTLQVTGTIAGETERVTYVEEMLRTVAANLVWTLSGGSLQLDNATVTEVSATEEAQQGRMGIDVTLEGEGVTVT